MTGSQEDDREMLVVLSVIAALVTSAVASAGVAAADPTPSPSPPYVIQTPSGPTVGGLQTLPPICAVQPRACNLNWDPNTGAWDAAVGNRIALVRAYKRTGT